jgi:hypothetical protein
MTEVAQQQGRIVKRRSPFFWYFLTMITGGFFGLVWVYLLMSDINRLATRERFRLRPILAGSAIWFIGYACLSFFLFSELLAGPYGEPSSLILTAMAFAFIFVVALYSTIVIIHCNIRAEMGARFSLFEGIATVILTIVTFLSLPWIQARLNDLIEKKAHTS